MVDLYDEMYEDDDLVTFEKFRQKPKQKVESKKTKHDLIREKRIEKAIEREEIAEQEIHGIF